MRRLVGMGFLPLQYISNLCRGIPMIIAALLIVRHFVCSILRSSLGVGVK